MLSTGMGQTGRQEEKDDIFPPVVICFLKETCVTVIQYLMEFPRKTFEFSKIQRSLFP